MPRSVANKTGRGPRLADHELMAAVNRVARRNRHARDEEHDWDRDLWMSYVDPANEAPEEEAVGRRHR